MAQDSAMRIHAAATYDNMDESQKYKVELDTKENILCHSVCIERTKTGESCRMLLVQRAMNFE